MGEDDAPAAELVHRLVVESAPLPPEAPCCAACAGVKLDPLEAPVDPTTLLRKMRGCPLSVVAYAAKAKARDGHSVRIEAAPNLPRLIVDGKPFDPLDGYRSHCEGGSCS